MRAEADLDLAWLQAALGRMRESIVITDAALDSPGPSIRYVNAAFERTTGWASADIIGQSPRVLQCAATDRAALDRIRAALSEGRPISETVINCGRDGTEYLNHIYIQPIESEDGKLLGFMSLQTDLTEERVAADRLRRISEWFSASTDSSLNAKYVLIAIRGEDGEVQDFRFEYANELGAQMLATTREQLVGNCLSNALPPSRVAPVKAQCMEALATGKASSEEFKVSEYGPDMCWIRHQLVPVENGVVITSENISARKLAETELERREQWFRAAAEGNLNALFINEAVYDDDGDVVDFTFAYVNEQGGRMVSMDPADMIGRSICDLFPINRTEGFFDLYRSLFLEKRTWVHEFPIDVPGIRARYLRQLAAPWSNGLALSVEDITESVREKKLLAQERRLLQAFMENFPGAAWIANANGEVEIFNDAFSSHVQGPLAAAASNPLRLGHDRGLASGETQVNLIHLPMPGGAERLLETFQFPIEAGDGGHKMGGFALDVTDREQNLQTAALFSAITQASNDAMLSVSADGRICLWTPSAERFYGYTSKTMLGKTTETLVAPESANACKQVLAMLVSTGTIQRQRLRHVTSDGRVLDVEMSGAEHARNDLGERIFALLVADISDIVRAEKRAEFLARHEDVSGLLNITGFKRETAAYLSRSDAPVAGIHLMARISLPELASLRELFGSTFADALFSAFAQRANQLLGQRGALLARHGPDQMLVFISDMDGDHKGFIEAWDALRNPIELGNKRFNLNAKCGFCIAACQVAGGFEAFLRSADIAHGQAVSRPGNLAVLYDASMASRVERRGQIQDALSTAISAGELSLVLQPIYGNFRHPQVTGVEALLRWSSGELGFVSPGEFIPIAEESNAIVELGDWVLAEACRQLRQLHQAGYPRLNIAVNVAEAQLGRPDFVEWVLATVEAAGIEPGNLELEITERTLMSDTEAGQQMLLAIRRAGIKVSVDDFGTGYSSLSYLANFSIDKLKVDRSFVNQMTESRRHYSLVTTVLSLAKSLRLECVAEGVETGSQFDMLRTLGCHFFQGYYLAKPMPIGALLPWLAKTIECPNAESKRLV